MLSFIATRKCPLRGHILAPPEGLRAPGYPGSTPGVDPRSQGAIPRRFKRKKFFVTYARTYTWTDRRDGRNSDLDFFDSQHYLVTLSGLLELGADLSFKGPCGGQ